MTALQNKIQELWLLVTSPVEVEETIKTKCQAIKILGGDVDAQAVISLAKKVQPLTKSCYDLSIPMEKILESIPEDLGDGDLIYDLSWHLQSLRGSIQKRVKCVDEELGKLYSAPWLTVSIHQESLAKIRNGLIPAHIGTLIDPKYDCMTDQFQDQIIKQTERKIIDSGDRELVIDGISFQFSSDGKELISDPVTYHFVCGGTDDIVDRASFYDAVMHANSISLRHGLQPVYRIYDFNERLKASTEQVLPYLKRILLHEITYENFSMLQIEEQKLLSLFFEEAYSPDCHLGYIDDGDDYPYFNHETIKRKVEELEENSKLGFPTSTIVKADISIDKEANGYMLLKESENELYPISNPRKEIDLVFGDFPENEDDEQWQNYINPPEYKWHQGLCISTKKVENCWFFGQSKTNNMFGFRLKRKI